MRTQTSFLVLILATLAGCGGTPPGPVEHSGPECPTFQTAWEGLPTRGEWRTLPATADINQDGFDDIAVIGRKDGGPRVYLSDGIGGWTEASEGLSYGKGFSCGVGARLGDLNGDGIHDLLVADHCTGVRVFIGDGGTSWTESSGGIPQNLQGFNDADIGDLDGDGLADIVAISAFSRGFLVLKGRRDGFWKPLRDSGLPRVGGGWQLKLFDVNHDGLLDVICTFNPVTSDRREQPPSPAKVWLQGPALQFRPADGFPDTGRFFSVAVHDRDERIPELVFGLAGAEYGLYHWESADADTWTNLGRIDVPWFGDGILAFSDVEVADFNGDSCDDLLILENTTRKVWLAVSDCNGGWKRCPGSVLPMDDPRSQGWGLATGDLNGDGRLDAVASFGTRSAGRILAWFQSDARVPPGGWGPVPDPDQGHGPPPTNAARASGVSEPTP